MNGLPEPHPDTTRLVHDGRAYIITGHAPNADSWRYECHPVDLAGSAIHLAHADVHPVLPPAGGSTGTRGLLVLAGLDLEHYDQELAAIEAEPERIEEPSPELNLIQAVALWAHGSLSSADLKATYLLFTEGQTA